MGAAVLAAVMVLGGGCQPSPLSARDDPHSPYERFQSLRGYESAGGMGRHQAMPGGGRRSLRDRLRPMEPY